MWPKSPPSLQVVTHNARMDEERGRWGRPDSRVALLRPQTFGSLIQFMNSNVKVNPMFDFHPFKYCFETPGTVCCFETPGDVFSEFAKMQRWAGESFFTLDLGKIIIRSSLHKDQPNPWRDPIYVSSPTCSIIKMLYFLSKVKITIVNPPDSSRIILPHRGVSTKWSALKSYVLPLNIANVVILKLPRILPWCFLPPLPWPKPEDLGESSCGHHLSAQSHAVVAKLAAEDGLQQLRRKELVHDLLDLGAELSAAGHGFIQRNTALLSSWNGLSHSSHSLVL